MVAVFPKAAGDGVVSALLLVSHCEEPEMNTIKVRHGNRQQGCGEAATELKRNQDYSPNPLKGSIHQQLLQDGPSGSGDLFRRLGRRC